MSLQYNLQKTLWKTLFYSICQLCERQKAAFRGYLCVKCIRTILKDYALAEPYPEVLLMGSFSSMRLLGIMREQRYSWALSIFHKFFTRKCSAFSHFESIVLVPQRGRGAPTGLQIFCQTEGAKRRVEFIKGAVVKDQKRAQHGATARDRMDCERFIFSKKPQNFSYSVLLVDDVETTGTSFLQTSTALREISKAPVQRFALVKAWDGQKQNAQQKCC